MQQDDTPPASAPPTKPKGLGKTKYDLQLRAKKIAKGLLGGQSATEAVRNAGYSKAYANNHATEIVAQPLTQRAVQKVYEAAGITDEYLANKHQELLNAKEIKVFNGKDGLVYSEPLDDNNVRLQAVKLAHQIKGNLDTGDGKSGAGISIDKCVMLLNR